jgi:MoxR-like ATPase
VVDCQQIVELQRAVRTVQVHEDLYEYILDIVAATRHCDELHVGVSTRGALCLYRAAQASALIGGRRFVIPDDIKRLSIPILAHRVIAKGYLHGGQREAVEALIRRLVEEVPIPD